MVQQVSPGVAVTEFDTTTTTPAVATSTGAFVGTFNWGPVLNPTMVVSEVNMNNKFGTPDQNTAISFLTCSSFLAYSSSLLLTRADGTGQFNATGNGTGVVINNENVYFNNEYQTNAPSSGFSARYPGAIGNSIRVITWANGNVWTANSTNTADPLYSFANYFSRPPGTSPYVSSITSQVANDEMHVLVVDAGGLFSGVANSVLEHYTGLSKLSDAVSASTGGSNYYKNVLFNSSAFIYAIGVPSANVQGWGQQTLSLPVFVNDQNANNTLFSGGADGTIADANLINGLTLLENNTQYGLNLLFTGNADATIQNFAIQDVAGVRNPKDCVVFCSPPLANVQSVTGPAAAIASYVQGVQPSSYAVFDSGWKYMYDKYNDIYRWIPLNGDIAGLCAYTDSIRDPWWSPAGLQRGVIKNVVKLAYNPGQTDRNTLYQASVNPVVSFPGEGTILFGDKTFLNYSSAFSRINVRRLFIVLETTIAQAARASLFEFNDTFTRASFVNLVTPFLRTVMGRRGITDFDVVCDTTNNTPAVIDANQFVGDIYIKPAKSINYIQLNFVAVGTGVSFSEVIGNYGGS
jgi:phage tail sheath protein FI